MSPAFKDAPAVLARHGVPPDADADALLAELEARGWQAQVEELAVGRPAGGAGNGPRFRALAIRPHDASARRVAHDHRQGSGRTAEVALRKVLAAVLEQGG